MAQEDISFTDLIASSIHDMKNSLNVQISVLEKLAAQYKDALQPNSYQDLGRVIYQANRMNANLIQLLSLYKLEKQIYPIDIAEHNVAEVIDDVLRLYQPVLDFKRLAIEVDCAADCYWYMDRDLISGVVLNALNNAFQYTSDTIRVVARIENDWLELRVEDNGSGYPPSMLRDEAEASSHGVSFITGSTGLGFHFSSQVMHMHRNAGRQGMLIIENGGAYGGGCFVIRLP